MEWLFVATYASLLIFIEKYIDLQQELDELKDEKKESR